MGFRRRQIDRHRQFLLGGMFRPKKERIRVKYTRKQKYKKTTAYEYE